MVAKVICEISSAEHLGHFVEVLYDESFSKANCMCFYIKGYISIFRYRENCIFWTYL